MWKRMINHRAFRPIMITGIAIIAFSATTFANPGSEDDPLVTLSYVQKRLEQIKFYVEERVNEVYNISHGNKEKIDQLSKDVNGLKISSDGSPSTGDSTGQLEVVLLKEGQKLIAGAGTEAIVRSGKVKAIAGELGGLSDVTGAIDLKMDQTIPYNHLLIIPRADGRGLRALENSYIMVRGDYEIE